MVDHRYNATFWYPANVAIEDAELSVIMKAPEYGDSLSEGRIQTITKTRGGAVVVYDHGTPFSKQLVMQFKDVIDNERSALIVFFDAVGWGSAPIRYRDYHGTESVLRVTSGSIPIKNNGYLNRDAITPVALFDFDIEFMDVTNNNLEIEDYVATPTSLSLHIADTDAPHAPETTVLVDISDGTKIIDSLAVDRFDGIIWLGVAKNEDHKFLFQVQILHDGFTTNDATAEEDTVTKTCELNGSFAEVSITADLVGSGTSQLMRLKAAVSVDGYELTFRRIYIGKLS